MYQLPRTIFTALFVISSTAAADNNPDEGRQKKMQQQTMPPVQGNRQAPRQMEQPPQRNIQPSQQVEQPLQRNRQLMRRTQLERSSKPQIVPQRRRDNYENTPSMSRMEARQKVENRPAVKEQIRTFVQNTKMQEIRGQQQNAVKRALPQQIQNNQQAAQHVRDQIRKRRPEFQHAFNDTFFERRHYHPEYYHSGVDWWRPYPWVTINVWLGSGWQYPVFFDAAGYPYAMTQYPAGPSEEAVEGDWLTLGVFAAARSVSEAAFSPMLVQLALNKAGDLAGTYYNASADQAHELNGIVDRDTQQVVWKVSDNPDSPIMTTGLYNLTQDVATVQVHFLDGSEQPWVLVRLRSN